MLYLYISSVFPKLSKVVCESNQHTVSMDNDEVRLRGQRERRAYKNYSNEVGVILGACSNFV